jgi:hypothetical protein
MSLNMLLTSGGDGEGGAGGGQTSVILDLENERGP